MADAWTPYRAEPFITVGTPSPAVAAATRPHALRCAAWLAWRFRADLRRIGEFHLVLPHVAREPAWLGVALRELAGRRGWSVATAPGDGVTRYRVAFATGARWA